MNQIDEKIKVEIKNTQMKIQLIKEETEKKIAEMKEQYSLQIENMKEETKRKMEELDAEYNLRIQENQLISQIMLQYQDAINGFFHNF
jgi:phage host-nuclease inhibitor protein Gam